MHAYKIVCIGLGLLIHCASSPEQQPDDPPIGGGALRPVPELEGAPQFKNELVGPGPAAAKPDSCAAPCKKYKEADARCDKAAADCAEKYQPLLSQFEAKCMTDAGEAASVCRGDGDCIDLVAQKEKLCTLGCADRAYADSGCKNKDGLCGKKLAAAKNALPGSCACGSD